LVTGLSVLPKISARNLDLKLNTVVNVKDTVNELIINYPASFLSLANSVLIDNRDGVNAVTVQLNRQLNTITIASGNFRAFNDAWIEQINLTGLSTDTQVTSQLSPLTQIGIGGVTN
jgi:hypothetical protein